MSSHQIHSGARVRLFAGPFEQEMQLRDVAVISQVPENLCIDTVQIGRVVIFRGTAPLIYLPKSKLYLTATIPQGDQVSVTFRSFDEDRQYIIPSIRAGLPTEPKSTIFELEEA